MEKTKLLTIAVIGLLLLNMGILGFLFFAPHPPKGPEGMQQRHPEKMVIHRLQLDDTQQQAYRKLIEAHRAAMEQLRSDSRAIRKQYYGLLAESSIDNTKVDSLRQLIARNQMRIDSVNFEHFEAIKDLCNPEQKIAFNGLVDDLMRAFMPPPPR